MKEFIEKNLENIKNDLKELVSYNSVLSNDAKPFGSENRKVLDATLKMMEREGLQTKNLDYYCGYGDIGQGSDLVGITGHLDIVPVGDGWNSDPFVLTEVDGNLYGRGVSDDKGAIVCSLYALKYLKETGFKFKKRFRLLVGCNEETGSKCMDYYCEHEEPFKMGFTPDSSFPGIYAEKGQYGGNLVGKSKIKDIKGGIASNIVNDKVSAKVDVKDYDLSKFKEYLDNKNIKYEVNGEDITVYGVSAHASLPDLGINAINHLFAALDYAGFDDTYTKSMVKWIGLSTDGSLLGLNQLNDDISSTTTSLGVISEENGIIKCSLDIRFPAKSKTSDVDAFFDKMNSDEFRLENVKRVNPLYYDVNSNWIQALKKSYVSVTGDDKSDLKCIGGGTYAKHLKNIIAFGCSFNYENNHIHETNEVLAIDSLKKQIEIYVETIKNLNEVE